MPRVARMMALAIWLDELIGKGEVKNFAELARLSIHTEIFNTDQGVQYKAAAFTGRQQRAGILVSMDGCGA